MTTNPRVCLVAHDIEEGLKQAEASERPIFVIGGGELYAATLARAQRVHLTTIDLEVEGNVFFSTISNQRFYLHPH